MKFNTQQLLFDQSPLVLTQQVDINHDFSHFINHGYIVIENLESLESSLNVINQLVHAIKAKQLQPWNTMIDDVQLSKLDMIPDCGDSIDATCQALHFDLGQPFAGEGHNVYGLVGLYMPIDSESTQTAQTRIVFLPELLKQQTSVDQKAVKQRLQDYVAQYGDGWKADLEKSIPEYHSDRLACFARVLDAAHDQKALHGDYDKTMAQWFSQGPEGPNICAEELFYTQLGYDLNAVEQKVRLRPGHLLIVDNLRCIHGRVGERDMSEIAQILYGIQSSTKEHTKNYLNWISSCFT